MNEKVPFPSVYAYRQMLGKDREGYFVKQLKFRNSTSISFGTRYVTTIYQKQREP